MESVYGKKIILNFIFKISFLTIFFIVIFFTARTIIVEQVNENADIIIEQHTEDNIIELNKLFNTITVVADQANYFNSMKKLVVEIDENSDLEHDYRYKEAMKSLLSISSSYSLIKTAWLISSEGNYFIEDNGYISDDSWNFKERPYYQKILESKSTFFTEPFTSVTNGEIIVSFLNPLRDENNNLIGAFGLDLDLSQFTAFLNNLHIDDNDYTAIVSTGGVLVTTIDGKITYQNFNDTDYPDNIKLMIQNNENDIIDSVDNNGIKFKSCIKETIIPGWRIILSNDVSYFLNLAKKDYKKIGILLCIVILSAYISCFIWIILMTINDFKSKKLTEFELKTGLLTFPSFGIKVEKMLKTCDKQQFAVLFKIKKFSLLTEILGRNIGDSLLMHIGNCMRSCMRENEFCCIENNVAFALHLICEDEQECLKRLKELDEKISEFKLIKNINYKISISYGCYEIKNNKTSAETIKQYLLIALSRQNIDRTYESTYVFYNKELIDEIKYNKELENYAEQALQNDEFEFYLQGKYDPISSKIMSAEALVRWNYKNEKMIYPSDFISLFEKNGFIVKLDFYVLEKVCQMIRKWIEDGIKPIPIAINLSRNHLENTNIVDDILCIIDKYMVPHQLIELEITESSITDNAVFLTHIIKEFHMKEISIAIDDFGTGYSTLNTLKSMFIDTLKIDREFFVDMETDERGKAVAKSVINMAKILNLKIVAEGIETLEQVEFLKNEEVDLIQGFYYSKPLPVGEFMKLLFENIEIC